MGESSLLLRSRVGQNGLHIACMHSNRIYDAWYCACIVCAVPPEEKIDQVASRMQTIFYIPLAGSDFTTNCYLLLFHLIVSSFIVFFSLLLLTPRFFLCLSFFRVSNSVSINSVTSAGTARLKMTSLTSSDQLWKEVNTDFFSHILCDQFSIIKIIKVEKVKRKEDEKKTH